MRNLIVVLVLLLVGLSGCASQEGGAESVAAPMPESQADALMLDDKASLFMVFVEGDEAAVMEVAEAIGWVVGSFDAIKTVCFQAPNFPLQCVDKDTIKRGTKNKASL